MYICSCNALTEKQVANLTKAEYDSIVRCGVCKSEVERIMNEKLAKV